VTSIAGGNIASIRAQHLSGAGTDLKGELVVDVCGFLENANVVC